MNNNHRFLSPNEVNQSFIRSTNTILILIYVSTYAYINTGRLFVPYTLVAIIYLTLTIPLYYWSLRCILLPHSSTERVCYRIIGLSGDIIFLSIVMSYANKGGTPLFFVYLWIIVGNGIRYGVNYLIISTLISIICFITVVNATPAWQSEELFPIAISLLISLVILPSYILILISRLAKALEVEKTAHKIKQSFLANINHELRTPLNSILNLTELMRMHNLSDKIYRMLDMISASANSQLQIINSILDISKIEAGDYTLNQRSFDLYALTREIQQIILPQVLSKKLKFYIYIDPNCNQQLIGAYDQIKQVLINLLGNAVKFTEEGYIKISVRVIEQSEKNQSILFQVSDTGIGIAKQYQKEIFKPFSQADVSITRKYGGTGLGISISDELAKLMGGLLSLESKLGVGTIFSFEIKLAKENDKEQFSHQEVRIYSLNLSPEHSGIKEFYSKLGFQIVDLNPVNLEKFDEDINNTRSIILFDENELKHFPETFVTKIKESELPKIATSSILGNKFSNHIAITSITPHVTHKLLLNSIKICIEFLPYKSSSNLVSPKTESSLNILIAEDDPTLYEVNKIFFSCSGHRVHHVKDGEEALTSLKSDNYDIAILDLFMPKLSGLDVAKQYKLSNQTNPIPIILLTADLFDHKTNDEYSSVFTTILSKPISPIELLKTIYNNLNLIVPSEKIINIDIKLYSAERLKKYYNQSLVDHNIIARNITFAGVDELLRVLEIYDNEVNAQLHKLSTITLSGDSLEIKYILHQLNGASMSIGATTFGEIVNHLSKVLNQDIINNILGKAVKDLVSIHRITVFVYRQYLSVDTLIQE